MHDVQVYLRSVLKGGGVEEEENTKIWGLFIVCSNTVDLQPQLCVVLPVIRLLAAHVTASEQW